MFISHFIKFTVIYKTCLTKLQSLFLVVKLSWVGAKYYTFQIHIPRDDQLGFSRYILHGFGIYSETGVPVNPLAVSFSSCN